MKYCLSLILFVLFTITSLVGQTQVSETFLFFDPYKNMQYKLERDLGERADRGGEASLTIPFFDDFSRYSLPTNDPTIPVSWQRWSDQKARINNTFAVSPLSIGVATLDGMDETGYPYNFVDEFDEGFADTLTSLPIDLSGYSDVDNLYLVFHYQGQGEGNAPEEEDSLYLDFYSPFGAGQWFQQWSKAGENTDGFTRVFIPITAPEFFLDEFRFRFRNHSTLSGNWDHWHIDYVILDQNIDPENFVYDDVAQQYPVNTLLNVYTSMPWNHYQSDPQAFMADNFTFYQNNLGPTENIASGWKLRYEDQAVQNFPGQDLNVNDNGLQEIVRTGNLNNLIFEPTVNDSCATFNFCVYHNPTDAYPQNDTTCFEQKFLNYYAYDDGSAERAFTVEGAGAQIAYRFQSAIQDTLLGIYVHWTPAGYNPSANSFVLRIWNDEGGLPGSEIIENFTSHNPQYYQDGYDLFTFYPFDDTVVVSGTFYVGWVQSSFVRYNVGNDKNIDNNTGKLFYKLFNGNWQQSQITGSLMIRPVFRAAKTGPVGVEEIAMLDLNIYPNPATDNVRIDGLSTERPLDISIFDLAGREVYRDRSNGQSTVELSVNDFSRGTYLLVVKDGDNVVSREKLMIH